jgi:hypothetical protein
MKKAMFFAILLLVSAASFSQQTNPSQPFIREGYLKKSKSQKTAAWVLLGGGFAVTVVGVGITSNHLWDEVIYDTENTKGEGVVIAGLALMAGSVPLFIASGRNRRKAFSVSMKNEKIYFPHKNNPVPGSIHYLSVAINF